MEKHNLQGQVFGEWTVLNVSDRKTWDKRWNCVCSCGKEKDVNEQDLLRGKTLSCGHNKNVDLTGKVFGEWTVLYSSRVDEKYTRFWMCRCSCGIEKEVRHSGLITGSTNCGHLNRVYEDVKIGDKFGDWTVIGDFIAKKKGRSYLCSCSCGVKKYVNRSSLLSGTSICCGHRHTDGINIGDVFGRLTIISFEGISDRRGSKYLCQCECGNKKVIHGVDLKQKSTISCGCYSREQASKRMSERDISNDFRNYQWYFLDDNNKKINCRSSYEVFLWNEYYFNRNIKNILYEPRTFVLKDKSRYTPDFYIPERNLWIETKGSFEVNENSIKQKKKIEELQNNMVIEIIMWGDLRKICNLKYKTELSYFNHAKHFGVRIEDYLANRMYVGEKYGNITSPI